MYRMGRKGCVIGVIASISACEADYVRSLIERERITAASLIIAHLFLQCRLLSCLFALFALFALFTVVVCLRTLFTCVVGSFNLAQTCLLLN